MRVTFWGAARTVTGSKHLLTGSSGTVLLDCGLFQGHRAESEARNRALPFNSAAIDAVVLSHAHIDHSGSLPALARSGFGGKIHATRTTVDLCRPMLLDAAHLQMKDAEFMNKRRNHNHKRDPVQPLYTTEDAERALELIVGQDYETPFEPIPGVSVMFHEAGQIAGAAAVSVRWKENGRE